MAVYRCESCGAPLSSLNGVVVSVCEYCGTENRISDNATEFTQQEPTHIEENILISTVPCIGKTVFEKKNFVIYRTYAEVLDRKTNAVELHLDFEDVAEYRKAPIYDGAIKFKMKNGQKYLVNLYSMKNYQLAMNALNGLIKV